MTESRILPLHLDSLSSDCHNILKKIPGEGLKGKFAPINVLGTLMYGDKLLPDFLEYWVNSKLNMSLSVREQELVILRMALHFNCDYVWKHHVPVAQEFCVNDEELSALKKIDLPKNIFSSRDEALILMTDDMMRVKTITDSIWNTYKGFLTDRDLIDLIHLISQYVLFALTNNVLRVKVETPLNEIESLHS